MFAIFEERNSSNAVLREKKWLRTKLRKPGTGNTWCLIYFYFSLPVQVLVQVLYLYKHDSYSTVILLRTVQVKQTQWVLYLHVQVLYLVPGTCTSTIHTVRYRNTVANSTWYKYE